MRVMLGVEGATYARLGAAIRTAREARGWTVNDLRTSIHERSTQIVEEIESGTSRCTVHRLLSIAHALGVSPAGLVSAAAGATAPEPRTHERPEDHST
jgi:ribosome-binding protein aMBF1 (putative translation factor)